MRLAELASAPLCCGVLEAGEKAPLSTSIWCRLRCRSRTASFVPRHASGGEVASPPRCRSVSSDDCREQADVGSDADLRTRGVNAAAAEAASRAEPQPSGSDASAPATDGDTILRATALLQLERIKTWSVYSLRVLGASGRATAEHFPSCCRRASAGVPSLCAITAEVDRPVH